MELVDILWRPEGKSLEFKRDLHELGLIEHWGSGIQRMTAACRDAGLDEPVLEEVGTHFRVTIYTTRRRPVAADETDRTILKALGKGTGLSTHQISRKIGRSERATRTRLAELVARGAVVEVGSGPRDQKRRYYLAAD
jgi:predicted HTH transcriptional regulator